MHGGPRKARSTRSGRLTGAAPGRYSDRLAVQKFKAELEGLTRDDTKSKFFKAVDNKMIDDGVVKRVPIKATLVVMPALLVQQWVTELAKHAPCLKVLVYEGAETTRGGKGAGICAKDLAEQEGDTIDETIVALQAARRGAKRQKGALSATGQVRVAELVKLFSVEEEQV